MVRQIKCCEEKCIYVESNGNKIELKICLCRKVLLLKEFIEKIIGLKPEFQELSLNGKIFNNDNDELSSLGVEENSIIELKINLYLFFYFFIAKFFLMILPEKWDL